MYKIKDMNYIKYLLIVVVLAFGSCQDYLDLEPTDKISANDLFSSDEGIKTFMAGLYYQLPIEDFNWVPMGGFNWNPPDANNAGFYPIIMTDEAVGSQWELITPWGGWDFNWWHSWLVGMNRDSDRDNDGYKLNRDINMLFDIIPTLDIPDDKKEELLGEAYFMRAYTYFELAKLYGGVPIITKIIDVKDEEDLMVPRSTEKETWDFVLESCDEAIKRLGEGDGTRRRANKWVALALKSRAALHAASVAKYWDRAPLSGEAVDKKLVGGMTSADAQRYYQACIDASEILIEQGPFSLYKSSPANPAEAAENYRQMFEDPNRALNEVIFMRGYTLQGPDLGHDIDNWGNPNQTRAAWPHPGRFNPALDLVDQYESYSRPGEFTPIVTTDDGDVNNYEGYNPARTYLKFDDPRDLFADKDARLWASTIIPNTTWKNTQIVIQGGVLASDGTLYLYDNQPVEEGGKTYYAFGDANPAFYSGFDTYGGNMTRTGFGLKKFLNQNYECELGWNKSTQDWIEFRLAEVMLNYAEAVAESGQGDAGKAADYINAIRHRAAHTTDVPLTLDLVLRERQVELAFENKRYWDLIRRREYHTRFNNVYRHALVPIYDIASQKYMFVRANSRNTHPRTFLEQWYYKTIPGVSTNNLVQNPQY